MIVVLESSCNFFVNMASPSHTCNESFAVSFSGAANVFFASIGGIRHSLVASFSPPY